MYLLRNRDRIFVTYLLKSGAKSALTAVVKMGLDVKTHGVQAVKITAGFAMSKINQKFKSRKGDGILAGLVKRGPRQSIKAGYRKGLDVLESKRSLDKHCRQPSAVRKKEEERLFFLTDLL